MPGVTGERTRSARAEVPTRHGLVLAAFRAVRYDPDRIRDLADVTAPPYDVIDADDQATLQSADPHNIVRLILPSPGSDGRHGRYAEAAQMLRSWRASGVLVADHQPALYLYEQAAAATVHRGLIGAVALRGLDEGIVLPHEDVRPEIVADRLELMLATAANLEPILLQYEGGGALTRVVEPVADTPPLVQAQAPDGTRHRIWRLDGPARIAAVQAELRSRQALIADGHHRYAAYLGLQAARRRAGAGAGPWDYGLALLIDSSVHPLHLHAIHRVLPGRSPEELVKRLGHHAEVQELPAGPAEAQLSRLEWVSGPAFLLAGGQRLWLVHDLDASLVDRSVPRGGPPAWRELDAAVLDHVLLQHIWKVPDSVDAVAYHHSVPSALRHAERSSGTAILLRPARVDTVLELARQRVRMPRKSTSFGPKPRSGLVLRLFDTE
jgi:uncharacterized protein (DUF1015 family)